MRLTLSFALLLLPSLAHAQAYRVGSGIQAVPRASAPTKATANGALWWNSSTSSWWQTTPAGVSTAAGGGGITYTPKPIWWSPVQIASRNAPAFTVGNFTVGQGFIPLDAMTQTGVKFYYPDTTSRAIKVSLWDDTGTRVATSTATYSTVGVKTVTWSSPVSVTAAHAYALWFVSFWETGGSGLIKITSAPAASFQVFPAPNGESITWRSVGAYASGTGDVIPNSFWTAGGDIYPIEPVFTVP